MKELLGMENVWQPIGPYTNGVKKGNMIFVSGTVGIDKDGNLIGKNDVKAQARQAFENIRGILAEGGATMYDVMKITVFMKSVEDYQLMNEVRREFFPKDPPASTAVVIKDFMLPDLLLEAEVIAVLD